jgi:hypothetical protein
MSYISQLNRRRRRRGDDDHEDDNVEDRVVIPDGSSIRVPMYAMDAVQHAMTRRFGPLTNEEIADLRRGVDLGEVHDGSGDALGLNRPGFRYLGDGSRSASEAARQERIVADSEAWKTPLVMRGGGEHGNA